MVVTMKRKPEVVQQYEHHYLHDADHSPCPACKQEWSAPNPTDRSRELVHLQGCDFMVWLREPDPEDQ